MEFKLIHVSKSASGDKLPFPNLITWCLPGRRRTQSGPIPTDTCHYDDVIMGAIASLITILTIVYSTVYSDADKKTSKLRVTGLGVGNHRGSVNSPHKWPVTRKMFPFDDVIMCQQKPNQKSKSTYPYTILYQTRNHIRGSSCLSSRSH